MYRITYEQGNGYRCGCCRRTTTETIDFETPEAVQYWVNELYADFEIPLYEDDDDRCIESIEKEIGVDIQDQFRPQKEVVDKIISERQKKKEIEKKIKKEEKEREEYENFLKLKEKFKNK